MTSLIQYHFVADWWLLLLLFQKIILIRPSKFGLVVKLVFVIQTLPDFCNPDSYAGAVDCNQLRWIRIPFLASVLAFQIFLHEWLPLSDCGKSSLNRCYRNSPFRAHAAYQRIGSQWLPRSLCTMTCFGRFRRNSAICNASQACVAVMRSNIAQPITLRE